MGAGLRGWGLRSGGGSLCGDISLSLLLGGSNSVFSVSIIYLVDASSFWKEHEICVRISMKG